jgi:glycosyltransferase involved in cell wall biosynthesis
VGDEGPTGFPRVTVVTPSFNYARFIQTCLESVHRQTWPNLEHIVLDAGSTDGSRELLRSFRSRHPLTLVFEEDEGQADALNRGFARARGEVFCWLNADDYWLDERVVEEAMSALKLGVDVVTAGGEVVDERGRRIRSVPPVPRVAGHLHHYDPILQPATFWRRKAHRALRIDLDFTFDWQLFIEMRDAGATFSTVDKAWAAYRWHGTNKTAADPARRRGEVARILAEQCGPGSVQARWARLMHGAYEMAERRNLPALKRAAHLANSAMSLISGRRVFSS